MDEMKGEKSLSAAKKQFWGISLSVSVTLIAIVVAITHYHIHGSQLVPLIAIVGISSWLYLFSKFTPRCPHCGQGIYSVAEVGRIPIIVRWPHGKKCLGCGKDLNE